MTIDKRKVLSGFGWLAMMSYTAQALGLVTTLILAKLLTPNEFGLIGIASILIEMLRIMRDMGLSEALIYQKDDSERYYDTAHTTLVGLNVVLFLLITLLSPVIAWYYAKPILMPVVIAMASNLIWDAMRAVPRTLYRKQVDFKALVIPEMVPLFVAAVVSILAAAAGLGVWSLVIRTVLHSALAMVLMQSKYRPRFRFDKAAFKDLMGYGKFIVGSTVLFVVLYNIDRFYVSLAVGVAAMGAFELAMRVSEMPVKQVSFLVGSVMFPVLAKLDGDGDRKKLTFLKTLRYVSIVTSPVALGLSAFGPPLIHLIYGERWALMEQPLRILGAYALFRSMSSLIHDAFKASGRPDLMQNVTMLKLALIGGLGLPALYKFGLQGICWLILGTYAVAFVGEIAAVSRVLQLDVSRTLRGFLSSAGSAAVAMAAGFGAAGLFTVAPTYPRIAAGIVIASAIYLALIALLERRTLGEMRLLLASKRAA